MSKIKCNFCDRKGLLIYPVRYAVACPAGAAPVPGLSGNFRIDNAPAQIGTAKYTLRALRAGYLYSYDEKRKRLKAYIVMPMGYLCSFPTEYPAPNPAAANFSCVEPGDIALAHCVDIEHTDADPAGMLWLGWSSVVWTKALLKKVDDATWRAKHMQKIDVKAMVAGHAAHTEEFANGQKKIAHFALKKDALHKAFDFSNTPVNDEADQHDWAAEMASFMAAQAPQHKGFIVAVNDPVGITNDLSELTLPTVESGFDESMYRASVVADLLATIEHRIRKQAKDDVDSDDQTKAILGDNPDGNILEGLKTGWKILKAGGQDKYQQRLDQDKYKYGQDKEARKAAAADRAWEDITTDSGISVLDQTRLNAFPAQYEKTLKAYEPIHHQLAAAHLGGLTSFQLFNWMDGVHDDQDISGGYAYSESTGQCIGKAVAGRMCFDQLSAWLDSPKISDIKNLYIRALLFNQTSIIAATENQIKAGDFQFESVFNIYREALNRLERGIESRLLDRLALTTANVLVAALKRSSHSHMRAIAMLHLRLLGGVAIKPGTASPEQLAKWIVEQVEIRNIPLSTNSHHSKIAATAEAERITRRTAGNSDVIYLELDIEKIARDRLITAGTMNAVKIPGIETTRNWLGSSTASEFRLGAVVTIIQLFALSSAIQDLESNNRFNEMDTRFRASVAAVSLSATIVETVASVAKNAPSHPMAMFVRSQWASSASHSEWIIETARYVGMAAGIASAAYDIFVNAANANNANQKLLKNLYIANGILSAATVLAALAGVTVLWPLFVASIILSIWIALVNMKALHEWISRCYFSVNFSKSDISNSFKSLREELNSYHSAIGE